MIGERRLCASEPRAAEAHEEVHEARLDARTDAPSSDDDCEQLPVQAQQHLLRARTREIHATDFARKQSIAGKDVIADFE